MRHILLDVLLLNPARLSKPRWVAGPGNAREVRLTARRTACHAFAWTFDYYSVYRPLAERGTGCRRFLFVLYCVFSLLEF